MVRPRYTRCRVPRERSATGREARPLRASACEKFVVPPLPHNARSVHDARCRVSAPGRGKPRSRENPRHRQKPVTQQAGAVLGETGRPGGSIG